MEPHGAQWQEDGDSRMRLLIAKGSFAPMGGAERDIIRNLPSLSKRFSLSVATLESSAELVSAGKLTYN